VRFGNAGEHVGDQRQRQTRPRFNISAETVPCVQGSGEQAGGSGTSSGSAGSSLRSRREGTSSGQTGSDKCVFQTLSRGPPVYDDGYALSLLIHEGRAHAISSLLTLNLGRLLGCAACL